MARSVWERLVQAADRVIDKQWGDDVRIIPWDEPNSAPDFTRQPANLVGVVSYLNDVLQQFGGEATRGRFVAQMIEMDITVSLSTRNLPWKIRQSDRVRVLDDKHKYQNFSIGRISEEITDRVTLHLLKLPQ